MRLNLLGRMGEFASREDCILFQRAFQMMSYLKVVEHGIVFFFFHFYQQINSFSNIEFVGFKSDSKRGLNEYAKSVDLGLTGRYRRCFLLWVYFLHVHEPMDLRLFYDLLGYHGLRKCIKFHRQSMPPYLWHV